MITTKHTHIIRPFLAFFILAIGLTALPVQAKYKENKDYKVLQLPVPTEVAENKVEVRELFWYYCPHCFSLEPYVQNWLRTKSNDAEFVLQPAVFSKRWESGAIFFFILEELNKVDELHEALLNVIHRSKRQFKNQAEFEQWLREVGVSREDISAAFSSDKVYTKYRDSMKKTKRYREVDGVPSIIVAGKYLVSPGLANGASRMFDIVDFLVAKEVALRK